MATAATAVQDVSLKDAFDIYQKQSDSIHKLWAYFQVVSLAVMGYTVGSDKSQWSWVTYLLVSSSYAFFGVSSHYVIALSQHELNRFAKAVQSAAALSGPVGTQLAVAAVPVWRVRLFHAVSAVVVIGAIWGAWYDKCSGTKQCPATAHRAAS
ncbi:MAG: hypothetical protein QM777_24035 [Pseudorhodoferax sp.]